MKKTIQWLSPPIDEETVTLTGRGGGQGKGTSIDIYNETKQHTLLCKEEGGDGDYAWRRCMREFGDDEVFLGDAIRLAAHQIEVWKLVIKVWKGESNEMNLQTWIVCSESIRERRKQWSEVEEKWRKEWRGKWNGNTKWHRVRGQITAWQPVIRRKVEKSNKVDDKIAGVEWVEFLVGLIRTSGIREESM